MIGNYIGQSIGTVSLSNFNDVSWSTYGANFNFLDSLSINKTGFPLDYFRISRDRNEIQFTFLNQLNTTTVTLQEQDRSMSYSFDFSHYIFNGIHI